MTDRPTDSDLLPEDFQDAEIEQGPADAELEARIDDWTTQDNAENIQPCATLYKYLDPTQGNDKAQVNYYRGNIPSRHEIGLTYGSGRYMLVLTRPAGKKQPRKSTSFRFPLHTNYDRLKMDKDEAEARKERCLTGPTGPTGPTFYPPANNAAIFKETFGMMQGMMSSIFTMLSPLLLKAQEPRQIASPAVNPADQLGMFTALKDVLKSQTKADIDFFTEMKKGLLSMDTRTDPDDLEEAAPEEKKSMLERLLAIAEPFIPILAQNTTQARIAAAGIKAMPQVQAAVKSITASPELLQRVVEYVEKKEGRDGAIIALKNMGIQTALVPPAVPAPRPAFNPRKMVPHIHGKRKDEKK